MQKKALAAEYTKRFPSAEQARCLSIRENKLAIKNKLFKNNVGFKEINHSMNIIANILQGSELETSANIPNIVAKKLPSTLRQNETIVLEENK